MKKKKWMMMAVMVLALTMMFGTTVYASGKGDVAGAIEGTWQDASAQIKTVVNKVVFPAIDLILAVFFFAKLGTAYFDYRKHGQFEWAYFKDTQFANLMTRRIFNVLLIANPYDAFMLEETPCGDLTHRIRFKLLSKRSTDRKSVV